tara:strand:- start:3271 stop:3921 length:651 start_codon:yes stop_codon:yes gene_type:complete
MKKIAQIILVPVILVLGYLIYQIPAKEMEFKEKAKIRIDRNIQKLEDIKQAQIHFKQKYNRYAENADILLNFLINESIIITKTIGEIPEEYIEEFGYTKADSIAEANGDIKRIPDTISAKLVVFDSTYLSERNNLYPLDIANLFQIPETKKQYNIATDELAPYGGQIVQVLEISSNYKTILKGLDYKNYTHLYPPDDLLKIGSLTEVSLNGNWKIE